MRVIIRIGYSHLLLAEDAPTQQLIDTLKNARSVRPEWKGSVMIYPPTKELEEVVILFVPESMIGQPEVVPDPAKDIEQLV